MTRATHFEHHVIVQERPLSFREITALGIEGWALFSVRPPESPSDGRWEHNFRRPTSEPARPSRDLRGGLDRCPPGPVFPAREPTAIRLRRREPSTARS